jgi:hypothetical protein
MNVLFFSFVVTPVFIHLLLVKFIVPIHHQLQSCEIVVLRTNDKVFKAEIILIFESAEMSAPVRIYVDGSNHEEFAESSPTTKP